MKEYDNILQNKELLSELLKQVDVLNSIHGGSVHTNVEVIGESEKIIIRLSAPSVSVDAFSIMLNFSKLTVSIFPENLIEKKEGQFMPAFVPIFLETFEIPVFIDLDNIKAVHEDNDLIITLPFKNSSDNMLRMIDIIEN